MQKCLDLMNIKIKNVISQIHGSSGIRMIKAILGNQRDPSYNSITKGTEYVEQGIEKYKENLRLKEVALVHKLAKKHNLQIASNQVAA